MTRSSVSKNTAGSVYTEPTWKNNVKKRASGKKLGKEGGKSKRRKGN